ncbi:MAG: hypothetical protein RL095_3756 [Verrucomicrobiota bacterium]|jgi:quinoprotein glucose dehydrogenase
MRPFSALLLLATLNLHADPEVAGFEVKAVTKPGTTKAVGALSVDSQGRVIVCEVNRFRNAVVDNRDFLPWVATDLTNDHVEQRLAMYEKFEKIYPRKVWTEVADSLRVLIDKNGDGFLEETGLLGDFREALDGPGIGVLDRDGDYFYTNIPHLWKIRDADYDGKPESRQSLSYGWGIAVGISGHDMHSPIWGPDGKIYFSIGDRGYKVKTQEGTELFSRNRGAVLRINPDGSGLEEVCTGLRNPQEIAFNDTFDLITVDNNADLGDKARVYTLIEGGDYGWVEGWQALTTFGDELFGPERVPPAWLSEKLYETPFPEQPWWVVPASGIVTSGPSGLVYLSTDSLGAENQGSFLVCDFVGSAASGVRRFKLEPFGAGHKIIGGEMWLKGCNSPDITLDLSGNLLVGDFGLGWSATDKGGIWQVSAKKPLIASAALFKTGFRNLDLPSLVSALASADIRVRDEAQAELVRLQAKDELLKLASGEGQKGPALFARLHALRGLGQLDAVTELRGFVKDVHPEIRTQALRALADAKSAKTSDFVPSLEDAEIRVRQAALVGMARKPDDVSYDAKLDARYDMKHFQTGLEDAALQALLKRMTSEDIQDPWLRASICHAFSRMLTSPQRKLRAYALDHFISAVAWDNQGGSRMGRGYRSFGQDQLREAFKSAASRRTLVVALRQARSPLLARFLRDLAPAVVAEAVAAISFENVEEALPALAEISGPASNSQLSELNQARALNANLRLNNLAGAKRLLDVLGAEYAPQSTRRLAGYLLRGFLKPWPMDPVEGKKLDWVKRPVAEDAKPLILGRLPAILSSAQGEALTAALKLAEIAGLQIEAATLEKIVLSSKTEEASRLQALANLGSKVSLAALQQLAREPSPLLRIAAIKSLVAEHHEQALPLLLAARQSQDLAERQNAWKGLGAMKSTEAITALREGLTDLKPDVALDIYLAAKKQPTLAVEVKALEDKLNTGPAGVWILAAQGGDAERGESVFLNPPSACECLKCHKVGNYGASEAGPNLKGFLSRIPQNKEAHALRALVAPSADIVPHFGFVSLSLEDGSSLAGSYLGEDASSLKIKVGNEEKSIALSRIKGRQNISAMPSLKDLLDKGAMKPEDLRDLNAFLLKIGQEKGKTGH